MTAHAAADARAVLALLQAAVDARDPDALVAMFDDPAVLIGTSGDTRDGAGLRRHPTAVGAQPPARGWGRARPARAPGWDGREVVPFHDEAESLGFAAFGDVVVAEPRGEERAPIRATLFAVRRPKGWRIRQFHGSIPSDF